MKSCIVVKFSLEGFHRWENAPKEVAFLRDHHRHLFYFELHKQVTDLDREIEIILFKREVMTWLNCFFGTPCNFETMSCEMIAELLMKKYDLTYCSVLEDNENGASLWN